VDAVLIVCAAAALLGACGSSTAKSPAPGSPGTNVPATNAPASNSNSGGYGY
jgi:hypothetical protein